MLVLSTVDSILEHCMSVPSTVDSILGHSVITCKSAICIPVCVSDIFNSSQLAKMKKYIPYMSPP